MIEITGDGFDADSIMKEMYAAANEQFAQATADRAIELGFNDLNAVDKVPFDLESDSPEIDLAWVETRAREIFKGKTKLINYLNFAYPW